MRLCYSYIQIPLLVLLKNWSQTGFLLFSAQNLGANYKKILRLSYDVIITYDNRK